MYKIFRGVPIPRACLRYPDIPIARLKVGESIFSPPGGITKSGLYKKAKALGIKISLKAEKSGFRVWRTK